MTEWPWLSTAIIESSSLPWTGQGQHKRPTRHDDEVREWDTIFSNTSQAGSVRFMFPPTCFECQNTAGNFQSCRTFHLDCSTQVNERHSMNPYFVFFPFHFVVDPFLGKISVPCMPGASATKQAPRCFGDFSPWRWNERSNPRGHEEVIDQQREELEAILMLLNWMFLSINGDWTLSFLFFCFTVLLQLCWLVWRRQQVAWRISSFPVSPFCFDLCLDIEGIVTL